jgi:hypothetical protein
MSNKFNRLAEFCDLYDEVEGLFMFAQRNPHAKIAHMKAVSRIREEDWYVIYEGELEGDYIPNGFKEDAALLDEEDENV